MKKVTLILVFFYYSFTYSQYKIFEENKENHVLKTNYSSIMYKKTKDIDPILHLYVFIDIDNQSIYKKKIKNFIFKNKIKNSIFYFVKCPSYYINDQEKEQFFLNFMCTILGEKKMIDSDLIIITKKNITNEYESERLKKLEFDKIILEKNLTNENLCQNYLNEINQLIINPSLNEIYKLIKH